MKKFLFAVVICIALLPVYGQQTKTPATLLWRISGKGLSKPSYLYGTIHLTDKRVFQLGDSVFRALEETEAFAAELDMNSIGTKMINQMMSDKVDDAGKKEMKVKESVSSETWNRYKKRLEVKLGKKADKITIADLDEADAKIKAEILRNGEMPTFLDAWLFGQARGRGKWVGGIEDFEDQFEHIADEDAEEKIQQALFDDNYYAKGLEWFIKTYSNQDLDSIDAFMYREESGQKDYIMIKRNLKMARRMDSLSAIRSTLFAVGAAHLPGDSGVITLLKARGFTVTPVFSSQKISPDKFALKAEDEIWYPVSVADSSYSLQMPGQAEGVNAFESIGMDMKTYFDVSALKMYMTISIGLPEERAKIGEDSLYSGLRKKYETKGKKLMEKKITVNGVQGREFRMDTDEGSLLMQIFLPKLEKVVINGLFCVNEKGLKDKGVEKFFQSFHYDLNNSKELVTYKTSDWKILNVPSYGFYAEMPVSPKFTKEDEGEESGSTTYSWQGLDLNTMVYYGIVTSVMHEGMYEQGTDSVLFESIREHIRENMENVKILDSAALTIDGYPAYRFIASARSAGEAIETTMLDVLRGGMKYHVFTVGNPSEKSRKSAERFFSTFRILPYQHAEWKTVTAPDKSFTTTLPVFIKRKTEKEEDDIHPDAERFTFFDSSAAVTGFIDRTTLPAWFWYSSDTAFLRARALKYASLDDTITGYTAGQKGPVTFATFAVERPGYNIVKKVKLVLNDDQLYELFGYFAAADLPGKYNRFYDDFIIQQQKPAASHGTSKAKELATALLNADSSTAAYIRRWWTNIRFTAGDLPYLQTLLLKLHAGFDTTYYYNLNKQIFNTIEDIDTNNLTVDFIRKNYGAISPKDEYVKPFVFSYLSGLQTKESFDVLKECLLKYSFDVSDEVYFNYSFYDSLQLTASLFPEIMSKAGSRGLWEIVAGGTALLLDSNMLDKKAVQEYGKYFITTAKRELAKPAKETEDRGYSYGDLIRALGIIATPETNSLLTQFSKFDSREIKLSTILAMLESKMQPDAKAISGLAATDEYRYRLYEGLKKANKLNLFPAAYLTQKQLGQSKLYEYMTEDEDAPEVLLPVAEKVINYKGKQQRFWIYKVSFSADEPDYYMGVAGPFDLNAKNYESTHSVTGVYWDKNFDSKNIDALLKEYFEQLLEFE